MSRWTDTKGPSPFFFTLGDNNDTVVTAYEKYDDTHERVLKNVAVGTGVILVCVTVSIVSGGVSTSPVCMLFASSAKKGTILALSSGGMGGVAATAITGIKTGDMEEAVKSGLLEGSESFKWGAIVGVLAGGVSEASNLRKLRRVTNAAEKLLIMLMIYQSGNRLKRELFNSMMVVNRYPFFKELRSHREQLEQQSRILSGQWEIILKLLK